MTKVKVFEKESNILCWNSCHEIYPCSQVMITNFSASQHWGYENMCSSLDICRSDLKTAFSLQHCVSNRIYMILWLSFGQIKSWQNTSLDITWFISDDENRSYHSIKCRNKYSHQTCDHKICLVFSDSYMKYIFNNIIYILFIMY